MSSLSHGLLERCKVCLFKSTPFSLCQRKQTLYIRLPFILLCFVSVFGVVFISRVMNRYSSFVFRWLIYFSLDVLCKRSFMKMYGYIPAQISILLHVYKCMHMHICVCMNICINWDRTYRPKTKVFTRKDISVLFFAKIYNDYQLCC